MPSDPFSFFSLLLTFIFQSNEPSLKFIRAFLPQEPYMPPVHNLQRLPLGSGGLFRPWSFVLTRTQGGGGLRDHPPPKKKICLISPWFLGISGKSRTFIKNLDTGVKPFFFWILQHAIIRSSHCPIINSFSV